MLWNYEIANKFHKYDSNNNWSSISILIFFINFIKLIYLCCKIQ